MKRFFGVASGFVLFLAGLGLLLVGAFGIASFGTDGAYESEPTQVSSTPESLALVADLVGVDVGIPFAERIGTASINVDSVTDSRVFIGLAPQPAVDEFLFGSPYDLITRSADNRWTGTFVPGVNTEISPPDTTTIWIDQGTGASPDVALTSDMAQPTMVVMNADGTPNVTVDLTVAFAGPRIFPASVAAIALGLALLIIGIPGMAKWGRRSMRETEAPSTQAATDHPPAYPQQAPTGEPQATVVNLAGEEKNSEAALQGWFRDPDSGSWRK